jgi:hypothetical protein
MRFTKFEEEPDSWTRTSRTSYEASDADALKGIVEVRGPTTSQHTTYPAHPAYRAANGDRVRSSESGAMNGVRGTAATGDYRMESYDEKWAEIATRPRGDGSRIGEVPGQIPLFEHRSKTHPPMVEYLRTTKGARAVAGPLLGIAARDYMNQGHALVPSDDLSQHSAPLVAKLNKNLGTQFYAEQSNGLSFSDGGSSGSLGMPNETATEIPRDEVNKGRMMMRRTLRNARALPDHGYAQTGLFDA